MMRQLFLMIMITHSVYGQITLPLYPSTSEYLIFQLAATHNQPSITLLSTTPNITISSFDSSTLNVRLEEQMIGDSWKLSVSRVDAKSYNEAKENITIISHSYASITGHVGSRTINSVHFIGSNTSHLSIYGSTLNINAPLVESTSQYNPVDVILQAPQAIALINPTTNELIDTALPTTHRTPEGKIWYTTTKSSSLLLFETVLWQTIPIAQIEKIEFVGESHISSYSTNTTYTHLITGPHTGSSYGAIPFGTHHLAIPPFNNSALHEPQQRELILGTSPTATEEIISTIISTQPVYVQESMSIVYNSTLVLIPIHAGATPLGLMYNSINTTHPTPQYNTTGVSSYNKYTLSKFCTTIVPDLSNDTMGYCTRHMDSVVYRISLVDNDTYTEMATHCPGILSLHTVSDVCGSVAVCNSIQLSQTATTVWKLVGSTMEQWSSWVTPTLDYIENIWVYPSNVWTCTSESSDNWLVFINRGNNLFMYDQNATETIIYTHDSINFNMNTISMSLESMVGMYNNGPLNQTIYDELMRDLYQPELYVCVLLCTAPSSPKFCNISLMRSTGGDSTTLSLYKTITLPFYQDQTNRMFIQHRSLSGYSSPWCESLSVFSPRLSEAFVIIIGATIYRCGLTLLDDQLLCAPVITNEYNAQYNFAPGFGQFVVVKSTSNEIAPYIFNMYSYVVSSDNVSVPWCWESNETTTTQLSLYNLGGIKEYAQLYAITEGCQYTSMVWNYTTGNIHIIYTNTTVFINSESNIPCSNYKSLPPPGLLWALFPAIDGTCSDFSVVTERPNNYFASTSYPLADGCSFTTTSICNSSLEIPQKSPYTRFSLENNVYCDADTTPEFILSGTTTTHGASSTEWDREIGGLCTTVHLQTSAASPLSILLAFTNTSVFVGSFHVCTAALDESSLETEYLPWMIINKTSDDQDIVVDTGHGFYITFVPTPPPPPQRCWRGFYMNASGVCVRISTCPSETYLVYESGPATDVVCAPLTTCPATHYESSAPDPTTDRVCSAISSCSVTEHVSIGSTPSTDVTCRKKMLACFEGTYLNTTENEDAAPLETINGQQCLPCAEGTTAFNENPDHQYHNMTSCISIASISYTCPDSSQWWDVTAVTGHPLRACITCRTCNLEATACTTTSDAVCENSLLGPSVKSIQQCPPRTYRDDSIPGSIGRCEPCSKCLFYKSKCTRTHDAICNTYSSEQLVQEVIIVTICLFTIWVMLLRCYPIVRRMNTKLDFGNILKKDTSIYMLDVDMKS